MNEWSEWIERYVREVSRHLPKGSRADVAEELRSLLAEQVEERIAVADRPAEEIALEVIGGFGEPSEVAGRYAPDRALLIGPRLFPVFKIAVGIYLGVYAALTAAWLAGYSMTFYVLPLRFDFSEGRDLVDVSFTALANLGFLLLAFVLLQWSGVGSRSASAGWDPRELPELPDGEPASRVDPAIGLAFGLYFLLTFNVAPEWFGFAFGAGDEGYVPLLHPEYRAFLPWLNAWLIPGVLLDAWVLWRRRRRLAERTAEIALEVFGVYVLLRIVAGGPFTRFDQAFDPVIAIVAIVLALVAVVHTVQAVDRVRTRRLMRPEPTGT